MSPLRFDFGPESPWPASHFRPWRELVTELHAPADAAFRALAKRWPLPGAALLVHDPGTASLRTAALWTGEETWDGEETFSLARAPRLQRALERRRSFPWEGALFVPLAVSGLTPGFLKLEGIPVPAGGDETFLADVAQGLALSLWRVLLSVQERRRDLHWRALSEVSLLVHQSLKPARLLEDAAHRLVRHLGLDRVKIFLWDGRKQAFRGQVSCTWLEGVREIPKETFTPEDWRGESVPRTWRAVPLSAAGETVGYLAADNLLSQQEIAMDEVHLLEAAAGQLALAVRNVAAFGDVEALATTDALTQLLLGRAFQERLEQECRRADRTKHPFAVCMMDVDKFKSINDSHGHPVGDKVLAAVAKSLKTVSRRMDVVARYAGDEFIAMLPNATAAQAMAFAKRVNESVRKIRIPAAGAQVTVSVSIGVSLCPDHGTVPADLVRAADEALYVTKRNGRDGATLRESENGLAAPQPGQRS